MSRPSFSSVPGHSSERSFSSRGEATQHRLRSTADFAAYSAASTSQQDLGRCGISPLLRHQHADTDRHPQRAVRGLDRRGRDGTLKLLRARQRILGGATGQIRSRNYLAAIPSHQIIAAHRLREPACNLEQEDLIAYRMPMRVSLIFLKWSRSASRTAVLLFFARLLPDQLALPATPALSRRGSARP